MPAIIRGDDQFAVVTYTGTGSSQTITGLRFQPDFVWIKGRSGATDHALYDRVRGVQLDLVSNSTAAETTQSTGLTAFTSDGFTIGSLAKINTNAATYVAWCWKAGGTTVSNTAGSISSSVSANTAAGISVVTYTGNATAGATVGHGLGVAPAMIICKNRSAAADWTVYHKALGNTQYLYLSTTGAAASSINAWQNTSPTSSVFSLGISANVNGSGNNIVAYCFAEIEGFSKFGSYTGNGSTDGPFVYTGFRPRLVMIKRSDGVANWTIVDTSRNTANVANARLFPSTSDAESTAVANVDILSNGFKVRIDGATDAGANASGGTYIFAAFGESPFNYSRAR